MKCPKCGGEMEEGFIADTTIDIGITRIVKKQVWEVGAKLGGLSGMKNPHEVRSHRCKSCGYLESYAK